jgi:alanyl-tRNA synthetase
MSRTGDIDNVRNTAYHHTFLRCWEFRFGDYFKRRHSLGLGVSDEQEMAGLDPARLSVTVYLGTTGV